jgi:hypothetical protein
MHWQFFIATHHIGNQRQNLVIQQQRTGKWWQFSNEYWWKIPTESHEGTITFTLNTNCFSPNSGVNWLKQ